MKQLIVVRHAKSSWKDPTQADFDRSLNARGHRVAPRMAQTLAHKIATPLLILSSPAMRARQTACYIALALNYEEQRIRYEHALYGADLEQFLQLMHGLDDRLQQLLLVGHNPGITNLVNYLCQSDIDNIPTCGICLITLNIKKWAMLGQGQGELLEFDYPKKSQE